MQVRCAIDRRLNCRVNVPSELLFEKGALGWQWHKGLGDVYYLNHCIDRRCTFTPIVKDSEETKNA